MTGVTRIAAALGLMLLASSANAEADGSPVDVAGGYTAIRQLGTTVTHATDFKPGWFVSAGRQAFVRRLWIAGDVSGASHNNLVGETARLVAVLAGAHVAVIDLARVRVSGQLLAGFERFSEPGFAERGPAVEPGMVGDAMLTRRLGVRALVGYRLGRENKTTFKEVRASIGAVARLGR